MDGLVFVAVLCAALLHAGWNASVKSGIDRLSGMLVMTLAMAALSGILLPFVTAPAAAAIPWIIASSVLHVGYKACLVGAYEHGDLSQVYPLARGTAPLVVALVSGPLLGETLPAISILAIVLIGAGVVLMSMKGGANLGRMRGAALAYALGTAAFTASYTLVDGMGARISGSPSSYLFWLVLGDAVGTCAYALYRRGPAFFPALIPHWRIGLLTGAMSLGAYWIALWAFSRAPIALVAALRETSVLFAMLIAVLVLRERATPWRWMAAMIIVTGVVLLRL
jgi:drug/metabolite transporter (DMT)-like permease